MKKQQVKMKVFPKWKNELMILLDDVLEELRVKVVENKDDDFMIKSAFKEMSYDMEALFETYNLEAKDCLDQKDFIEDFLTELDESSLSGVDDIEQMSRIIEKAGYGTIKCESLAEVIKFEAFREDLAANPYQLNLAV